MAGAWTLLPGLLASAALAGLAGWLLWLRFASRVHRAFAQFCAVLAAKTAALAMLFLTRDPGGRFHDDTWAQVWDHMVGHADVGLLAALVWFLMMYLSRGRRAWHAWTALALAGGAAAGVALGARWPCLQHCVEAEGTRYGPLLLSGPLLWVAYSVAALLLGARAARHPDTLRGRADLLVSYGFSMLGLLGAGLHAWDVAASSWAQTTAGIHPPWMAATYNALPFAALPLLGWAARCQARAARALGGVARRNWLVGTGLAVASVVWVAWRPSAAPLATGVWLSAFPALVAFALVRHRLFDADAFVRAAFTRTLVAGVFVAVFFYVSEGAVPVLTKRLGGPGAGLAATAVLVFFLAPLHTFAERFTHRVLPADQSLDRLSRSEKHRLYRDQVVLVWQDGLMGRKERMLLDNLRDRLALSYEEAGRIEHQAVQETGIRARAAGAGTALARHRA